MTIIGKNVLYLREKAGMTQDELAKLCGVKQQSIDQLEKGDIQRPRFILKLAKALNVQPDDLYEDFSLTNGQVLTPINKKPSHVVVCGYIQAGVWREVDDAEAFDMDYFVPASPGYPVEYQKSYKVSGESLNKVAKDGELIVCLDLRESGAEVKDGDIVVVQKTRFNGQQIQRTVKRYRETTRGPELWPESDHPNHQEKIALDAHEEHESIEVIAKVLWAIRPMSQ